MGKFDFEISPEFIKQLGRLADVDRLAPKMIDEAIPILLDNVKRETAPHKQTGDMYKSIKPTKAKATKKGGYCFGASDRRRFKRRKEHGEVGLSGIRHKETICNACIDKSHKG